MILWAQPLRINFNEGCAVNAEIGNNIRTVISVGLEKRRESNIPCNYGNSSPHSSSSIQSLAIELGIILCLSLSKYEQMNSSKPKWLITFEMETSARSLEIIRIFDKSKFNYQLNAIICDNSLNESFTWQIDEMSLWWIKSLKWMWINCICVWRSFTRIRFNGTL